MLQEFAHLKVWLRRVVVMVVVVVGLMVAGPVRAGMRLTGPDAFLGAASPPNGAGVATVFYGSGFFGATAGDLATLGAAFPGWTFNSAGDALGGRFDIAPFEAYASNQMGGATLDVGYTVAATDPPIKQLEWLQIRETSLAPGAGGPGVDNGGRNDTPFYNTPQQDLKLQGVYGFSDNPQRAWPDPPQPPYMISSGGWEAHLYLASWNGVLDANGNGTVTLYGGFDWGFYEEVYPAVAVAGYPGGYPTNPG
jgi:hypothetical protein